MQEWYISVYVNVPLWGTNVATLALTLTPTASSITNLEAKQYKLQHIMYLVLFSPVQSLLSCTGLQYVNTYQLKIPQTVNQCLYYYIYTYVYRHCLGHDIYCVSSIQFVVLDAWKRDALLRHEDDLRENLNLDGLERKLDNPKDGFMTVDEKKSIEDVEGLSGKVGRIVEILCLKGNKEFDMFLKLLKETGNRSLASKLRQSAQLYKSEHPRHGKVSCFHCMVPVNLMLHFPSLSSS